MKRKKGFIAVIAVIVILALAFVGYNIYRYPAMFRSLTDNSLNDSQVEEVREEILSQSDIKVLVAYFSYSGTTKNIANAISEKTGGDLFEITPQDGYSNVYMESNREIRGNERPALTDTVENMEEYDIVFVGYPVWWHATPAPINTFLESYDLTGKLIIPFCTSGGSDIDETMPTFLNSCDGLAVYGERRISGTSQIDGWLSELGLTGNAAQPSDETQAEPSKPETTVSEEGKEATGVSGENGKTLIVYFSWSTSGNTEKMATYIQEQIGGDLLELEPLIPYPTDYEECGDVALVERDENARPEIANLPDSISEYDTVFVGYPIWWHTAPMIIGTFLENYDLSGVEVYPFTQSASMDTEQFENSMGFVRESAAGANVHDGLFTEASDTEGILAYLTENGFVE
jgi:flavodoxin